MYSYDLTFDDSNLSSNSGGEYMSVADRRITYYDATSEVDNIIDLEGNEYIISIKYISADDSDVMGKSLGVSGITLGSIQRKSDGRVILTRRSYVGVDVGNNDPDHSYYYYNINDEEC